MVCAEALIASTVPMNAAKNLRRMVMGSSWVRWNAKSLERAHAHEGAALVDHGRVGAVQHRLRGFLRRAERLRAVARLEADVARRRVVPPAARVVGHAVDDAVA